MSDAAGGDELCRCEGDADWVLVDTLSAHPLHCAGCRGLIPVFKRMEDSTVGKDLVYWQTIHRSLYQLWLDSGEYEDWAAAQLSNPEGSVNQMGWKLTKWLTQHHPTYLWFFANEEKALPEKCPACNQPLEEGNGWFTAKCDRCRLVL